MGFSRQEYWSGLPCPPPGHLPDRRIEPGTPALAGRFFTAEPPAKPYGQLIYNKGGKNIQKGNYIPSISGIVETGQLHAKESKWTTFSSIF